MGKNKQRHNLNKPQNQYGNWCSYAEKLKDGSLTCECGYGDANICKGDRHNCIKTKYHKLASMSDRQKNEMNRH